MTDFEKLISVFDGKIKFEIRYENEFKAILIEGCGFEFDLEGNLLFSFVIK